MVEEPLLEEDEMVDVSTVPYCRRLLHEALYYLNTQSFIRSLSFVISTLDGAGCVHNTGRST